MIKLLSAVMFSLKIVNCILHLFFFLLKITEGNWLFVMTVELRPWLQNSMFDVVSLKKLT